MCGAGRLGWRGTVRRLGVGDGKTSGSSSACRSSRFQSRVYLPLGVVRRGACVRFAGGGLRRLGLHCRSTKERAVGVGGRAVQGRHCELLRKRSRREQVLSEIFGRSVGRPKVCGDQPAPSTRLLRPVFRSPGLGASFLYIRRFVRRADEAYCGSHGFRVHICAEPIALKFPENKIWMSVGSLHINETFGRRN